MHPRPFGDPCHQSFFDSVRKNIAKTLDLGEVFVADHDGLISARPDSVPPAGEALDLEGQAGVDIAHEVGVLFRIGNAQIEVVVIGQERKSDEADAVDSLGSAEDSEDDVVELKARPEEEAALVAAMTETDPDVPAGTAATGQQFARTPFVVSFQAGWFRFNLCTVHIYYGSETGQKLQRRIEPRLRTSP